MHLIRNSVKYIPSKKRKDYPGAVSVWERNWKHVEQLYDYTSAIRKTMYTTNAIESVNSSFRKVTRKGVFPNDDAVLKAMYLRILELYDKWINRPLPNWTDVRNQLIMIDKFSERIEKYEIYEFPNFK